MGRKFGFSFSARRAIGYSAAKGKLSRKIGIPLTRSGRQRKAGKAMGCCVALVILAAAISTIAMGQMTAEEAYARMDARRAAATTQPSTQPSTQPLSLPSNLITAQEYEAQIESLLDRIAELKRENKELRDRLYEQAAEEIAEEQTTPNYVAPYSGNNTGGSVRVRGYYRKDGTYVRPHTRSKPSR